MRPIMIVLASFSASALLFAACGQDTQSTATSTGSASSGGTGGAPNCEGTHLVLHSDGGDPCDICMREMCCAEMAACREYSCVLCANLSTGEDVALSPGSQRTVPTPSASPRAPRIGTTRRRAPARAGSQFKETHSIGPPIQQDPLGPRSSKRTHYLKWPPCGVQYDLPVSISNASNPSCQTSAAEDIWARDVICSGAM